MRPLRIFLCHSSGDKPVVRELYERLRADGFDPWLDEENLEAGQEWEKEIPKAVRNSDVAIVCLSPGSINKRGYVQKEIKFSLDVAEEQPEGSIFLIPLRLAQCEVPEGLRRWQWVNLFDEHGYERLLRALDLCSTKIGLTVEPASKGGDAIFGGVSQQITVLFADIRGFSALSESLPPEAIVQLLNKVQAAIAGIINAHGGVTNQHLGGGSMVLFGVPAPTDKDAGNAISAAVSVQQEMRHINEELRVMGLPEVHIGIGIHKGVATVGINGSDRGSEYMVIGDTVNVAARLEAQSQPGQIMLSNETADAADGIRWPIRRVGDLIVKGRAQPLRVVEVDWQREGFAAPESQ
ncbi:MAG TPA: adenylate/guanylate cyclase domain-containing protein [Blastocatellia bacterium]|nr:adenylate/guanylate cyclase domain-containing protein [Blastocatellia bacterium]